MRVTLTARFPASAAGLTMRLRLQDIVHLLAEGIIPALTSERKKALHLLNIGGGPAIDSLNAIILIQKEHPELLTGRPVFVHILDWMRPARILAGGRWMRFRPRALHCMGWRSPFSIQDMTGLIRMYCGDCSFLSEAARSWPSPPKAPCSNMRSDEEITANLQTLWETTPPGAIIVGSLTRADETGRLMNSGSHAALRFRGLEAFTTLVEHAGWRLAENITRPLSHDICLKKNQERVSE